MRCLATLLERVNICTFALRQFWGRNPYDPCCLAATSVWKHLSVSQFEGDNFEDPRKPGHHIVKLNNAPIQACLDAQVSFVSLRSPSHLHNAPENSVHPRLEMKTNRRRDSPRRYVMSSAERRKEIVERLLVRQIDNRDPRTPLIPIALK
jgi:hypothetical protein